MVPQIKMQLYGVLMFSQLTPGNQTRVWRTAQVAFAGQSAVGAEIAHAFCIGYYGASQTQTFSEASGAGADYLAEVCRAWEAEALRSPTRTVIIRTGAHLAF